VNAQLVGQRFQAFEDRRILTRDHRFAGILSMHFTRHGNWASVQADVEALAQSTGERIVVANRQGVIVADSERVLIGEPAARYWQAPAVELAHMGRSVGALYVGAPGETSGLEALLTTTIRTLVLVAGAACLGAVLLILGLSRQILAPVEALTAAARHMEAGDLSQRVDISSNDELGDLARAFNRMADSLARAEASRRNMIADVAHELRTPLTSIRGYLEAVRDGILEPSPEVIGTLREETLLLANLVDDLQDLSLAESGQLTLHRQPVALADVVDRAVEAMRARAEVEQLQIECRLPEELPLVDIDPRRIGQVVRNLLSNALTYTPSGGRITVAAREIGEGIEVVVEDTGTGIPPEDLPHIFERFYRADHSRSRATGGAGLGLSIARQFVEVHGGRIQVSSEQGQGARFTFTLPSVRV